MKKIYLILDWDGVIFERSKHLLYFPYRYFSILNSTIIHSIKKYGINGINPKNLIKEFLSLEKLERDEIIKYTDYGLLNIMYVCYKKKFNLYIISSSNEILIRDTINFYKNLLKKHDFDLEVEIYASSSRKSLNSKDKENLVKNLKKDGITLYLGDSYNDVLACKQSDLCFLKKSLVYYISPKKPLAKIKIRKLKDMAKLLYKI
ncbi:MAG: hypothetical protein QXX30_04320 [Candidatus Aenigmatarchaeota archaeon]